MKSCTLCSHAQRTEIDQELVFGTSLRNIAVRFGTSATALHRHKKHLAPALAVAREAAQIAHADSLLDSVKSLLADAQRLTAQAEQAQQLDVALRGIREIRGVLELLGKLSGELQTGTRIGIGVGVQAGDRDAQFRAFLDSMLEEDNDPGPMIQGLSDKQLNTMIRILPEENA